MTREINLELHGQDLRASCLADHIELQAINGNAFTEAELADYIEDSSWTRLLEPKYVGDGYEHALTGERQDRSREAAKRVTEILDRRKALLDAKYPFIKNRGRLEAIADTGEVYLWFLFVSLCHGFNIKDIPTPASQFEIAVSNGLNNTGLSAITVGTAGMGNNFDLRVSQITQEFPHLVPTLDEAVRARSLNDGGIDTFATLRCAKDTRHGHWAFIGQSTVAKSDDWKRKIHEPLPGFWSKVFGERIKPIPFFATPHHIPDDYLHSLFQNHGHCLLDRVRLTLWTSDTPDSFAAYKSALNGIILQ